MVDQIPRPDPIRSRRRRGPIFWAIAVLATMICVPVVALAVLAWAALDGTLKLPEPVRAWIVSGLDQAMVANRIEIGEVGLTLHDGGRTPEFIFHDVEMWDGEILRASFPRIAVHMNGQVLMRGQARPTHVQIVGAGVRATRTEDGQFNLALDTEQTATGRDPGETLARIDQMFASPLFDNLEEVTGTGFELILDDRLGNQTLRAHDASFQLLREGATLSLLVGGQIEGSRDATVTMAVTRNAGLQRTDLRMQYEGLAARDIAAGVPTLAWLDRMRVPISGSVTAVLRDDSTLGDLSAALDIGPGHVFLGDGVPRLPLTALSMELDFDAEQGRLNFSGIDLDAPALSFSASGHADVSPDGTNYAGQFQISDVVANPSGLFDDPVTLNGGTLAMQLNLRDEIALEIGETVLVDGDVQVLAQGEVIFARDGLQLRLDTEIPRIASADVLSYWPEAAIPNTRRWLSENLLGGVLSDVRFRLRRGPPDHEAKHSLRLNFEDVTLRTMPHMPPIKSARGHVVLDQSRVAIDLHSGRSIAPLGGAVDWAGSTMVIEDVTQHNPPARFGLNITGDISDVLSILELPPVNLFAEGRFSADTLGTGQADLAATLSLPFDSPVPFDEIGFDVTGTLHDVASGTLVPGRSLMAERLTLSVQSEQVTISGRAMLDGLPATGQWQRKIGPGASDVSRLSGTLPLSGATFQALGIQVPDWLMTGQASADFAVEMKPGDTAPELHLTSDLTGLGLSLPALGWSRDGDAAGALEATVRLGAAPGIETLNLSAPGLDLVASITLNPGGGFERLSVPRLRVGDWADVQGILTLQGAGHAPQIEVTGGRIDLRRAPTAGTGGGGAIALRLDGLDELRVSDGIALRDVSAEVAIAGGMSGQFRGNVNGTAPVAGTVITTSAGPAVQLRSDDGGAVLRAAGLYGNAYGGEMNLDLQPTGQERHYRGDLVINGPRLRNAPVMAELLSMISVIGLLEQLGGEGINLGQVETRFTLTPHTVVIEHGTAVGPSMGFSMDGVYNIASRQFDMQGAVSPFYFVNGVLGIFFAPRREGLFGFSYQLTGTPEAARLIVNPLSILTPGVFRQIFRRPPPDPGQ
ncbi:MAG: hypothetical protein GDA52_10040 [Rhodobacteraceae bacterium]|nr:hypothetical protein [Paracoccaceae bacterium]